MDTSQPLKQETAIYIVRNKTMVVSLDCCSNGETFFGTSGISLKIQDVPKILLDFRINIENNNNGNMLMVTLSLRSWTCPKSISSTKKWEGERERERGKRNRVFRRSLFQPDSLQMTK